MHFGLPWSGTPARPQSNVHAVRSEQWLRSAQPQQHLEVQSSTPEFQRLNLQAEAGSTSPKLAMLSPDAQPSEAPPIPPPRKSSVRRRKPVQPLDGGSSDGTVPLRTEPRQWSMASRASSTMVDLSYYVSAAGPSEDTRNGDELALPVMSSTPFLEPLAERHSSLGEHSEFGAEPCQPSHGSPGDFKPELLKPSKHAHPPKDTHGQEKQAHAATTANIATSTAPCSSKESTSSPPPPSRHPFRKGHRHAYSSSSTSSSSGLFNSVGVAMMRRLHRKSHSQSGRDAFGVDTTTAENVRLAEHADHDDSLGAISEVERELALLMEQEKCNKRRRSTIVPPRSTSISTMTMRDRDGREMRVVDMDDELILDNLVQHVSSLEMIAASRGSIERDASGVVHSAMTGGNDDVEDLNNVDCATGSCGTAYFASIFDQVPAAMTRIPPCSDALHHLNNSESLCEADCFSNASLRATFPFLEAVQQDESWCTGSILALTEDLLRTSVYHEAMSDAQLAATREERDRIHAQIVTLTEEFERELKFRDAALHLLDLYSSKLPISMATSMSAAMSASGSTSTTTTTTATTPSATMRRILKKSQSFKLPSLSSSGTPAMLSSTTANRHMDAMLERQRATDMSKEALHRTSTHIAILSSTLQTLHDRHTYLTSRLMSHVLVGWLRGVEALWRRVRGSELDLARMRQVVGRCESGGVAGTKDEVHVWRGISRILCEELVRVGGEKNGVRQEVDGDSIMEDQVEDEHHHLSTHDIIDEYYV